MLACLKKYFTTLNANSCSRPPPEIDCGLGGRGGWGEGGMGEGGMGGGEGWKHEISNFHAIITPPCTGIMYSITNPELREA